jgi:tRNA A-37 threonylcarbamoyl transferase component Bud32
MVRRSSIAALLASAGIRDSTDRRVKGTDIPRNETSRDFTPELLADAARRLGWLCLAYAGGSILAHFEHWAAIAWAGSIDWSLHVPAVFGFAAVLISIAVFIVSRRGLVSPRRLLDLGLVVQVVGAMGIAAKEYWGAAPHVIDGSFLLVPAECVWIVAYPLIVPNTPNKVLVASLLSASMGPAALALSAVVVGTHIDHPLAWATYFLSSNYLCAIVAYLAARIVHGFGIRLKHARDVGSYELIARIGQGAMGEVWRAKHRLLVRPAAVKLIRRDVLGANERARDALVRRFEREARDTATLKSIHTVGVYDFGVMEEGDFYYAMELLDGLSLERFIRVCGPIEPARAVYLLRQVCHSLGEAHARGLVHRDIKPANIFVCRLGPDDDFVKVLDFGIVKHGAGSATVTMLTLDGGTVGTPAYMAPEIALGHGNVDGRADIYSLGCVAYYLLTGRTVFSAETPVALALAHVQDEPVPPSERSEFDIPASLDALVLECLAKDPAARPASAVALEHRLAATVPHDAWTSAAAHAWWECHGAAVTGSGRGAETPTADTQGLIPREYPRFWPQLERRPLITP